MRRRFIPAAVIAIAAQSLGVVAPAAAAAPTVVPFAYTGGEQHFDVPAGVTSIHVTLVGGHGGGGSQGGSAGGSGAVVDGDLAVSPLARLYVEVGGNGTLGNPICPTTGGFNGGGAGGANVQVGFCTGGGGGASDLRTLPQSDGGTVGSRLIVAAGGGGGGFGTGATGGNAGQAGVGTGTGGSGGGGAGTASAGGAAGTGTNPGHAGALAQGGAGSTGSTDGGGGGGGGGYYGGGGGGTGGGGGGSSFVGSATNSSVTTDGSGTPSITITYGGPTPTPTPGPDNGTVHAQFSVPTSAACLELSTSSIDFGSVHLGSENMAATPDVTVTSCSGTPEDLFAHGSDATATGVTWTLVGGSATCTDALGTDNYRMSLESTAGTVGLSTTNAALGTLAAGDTSTQTARIFAACPGSSGAGQLMTTQITFLAVEGS